MLNPFFSFMNTHFFYLPVVGINFSVINYTTLVGYMFLLLSLYILITAQNFNSLNEGKMLEIFKKLYIFIYGVISGSVGSNGLIFFPFLFFLWMSLFFFNVIGLSAFAFTLGSHFPVTLTLSLVVWFSALVILVESEGMEYFDHFFPSSVDFYLGTFISFIETLSFIFRAVSLSLRLFANLVAGHVLLHLYCGVVTTISTVLPLPYLFIPLTVQPITYTYYTCFLTLFETVVSFVQSYVFLLLTCIYLQDTLNNYQKNKYHFSSNIVSFYITSYLKEAYLQDGVSSSSLFGEYFTPYNFRYRFISETPSDRLNKLSSMYSYYEVSEASFVKNNSVVHYSYQPSSEWLKNNNLPSELNFDTSNRKFSSQSLFPKELSTAIDAITKKLR